MVKPMTAKEGMAIKQPIPDFVIESVNEILTKLLKKGGCSFTQEDLIKLIKTKTSITRKKIYSNHYLDFEDLYRAEGWTVTYDKPAYNENYEASFKFELNEKEMK